MVLELLQEVKCWLGIVSPESKMFLVKGNNWDFVLSKQKDLDWTIRYQRSHNDRFPGWISSDNALHFSSVTKFCDNIGVSKDRVSKITKADLFIEFL